jgi:hypothetical protein
VIRLRDSEWVLNGRGLLIIRQLKGGPYNAIHSRFLSSIYSLAHTVLGRIWQCVGQNCHSYGWIALVEVILEMELPCWAPKPQYTKPEKYAKPRVMVDTITACFTWHEQYKRVSWWKMSKQWYHSYCVFCRKEKGEFLRPGGARALYKSFTCFTWTSCKKWDHISYTRRSGVKF